MANVGAHRVFAKTEKGTLEVRGGTVQLPRELGLVFLSVDGKATVADLLPISGMTSSQLDGAIASLLEMGYIREPAERLPATTVAPSARPEEAVPAGDAHNTLPTLPQTPARPESVKNPALSREESPAPPPSNPPQRREEREGRKSKEFKSPTSSIADLAQRLVAKVQAERRAREDAHGRTRIDGDHAESQPSWISSEPPPVLNVPTTGDGPGDPPSSVAASHEDEAPGAAPAGAAPASTTGMHTSAFEQTMMMARGAARASEEREVVEDAKAIPILDGGEPSHHRLNADRAAHDVLVHAADTRRLWEAGHLGRDAAQQQRIDEEGRHAARLLRKKRRAKVLAGISITIVALPILAVACLQVMPLYWHIPAAERALSERLQHPTTVGKLRYVTLPSPRLVLEDVTIGATKGIQIERLDALSMPQALLQGRLVFDTAEAHGVTIHPSMLATLPRLSSAGSSAVMHVRRLRLADVKLGIAESGVTPMEGEITFKADGAAHQVTLANDKLHIDMTPDENGARVALKARDSQIPYGPTLTFSYLTMVGKLTAQRFVSTEMSGRVGGGSLIGTVNARWDGPVSITGEFSIHSVRLHDVMPHIASDFSVTGILRASGRYAFKGASADSLLRKPTVEATFAVTRGELPSVDLMRAVQASGSATVSGGRTSFTELTGSLLAAEGHYTFRQLQLSSSPLSAHGAVIVTASGQLTGRVNAEVALPGAGATRTALTVGGTVKEPRLAY